MRDNPEVTVRDDTDSQGLLLAERNRHFSKLMMMLVWVGLAANIAVTFNWLETGWRPGVLIGYLLNIIVIVLLICRETISLRVRATIFQFCFTCLFITSILSVGYFSAYHAGALLLTATAYIFLGAREAIVQYVVCAGVYVVFLLIVGTELSADFISYETASATPAFKISYFVTQLVIGSGLYYLMSMNSQIQYRAAHEYAKLAEENEALISLISEAPLGLALWNPEGILVFSTKELDEMLDAMNIYHDGALKFDEALEASLKQNLHSLEPGQENHWHKQRIKEFYAGTHQSEYEMSDGKFVSAIDRKISNGFIASFRKDITHIKQAERKIRFITDNVTERVLTVGRKGDITFVNAGVEASFGMGSEELVGSSIHHLFTPQFQTRLDGILDTKDLNGFNAQVFTENVEAVRKDGTRFSVDVRCKRTQVEHGIELLMVIYDHSSLTNDELRVRQLHEAIQKITAGIALIAKTGKLSFFNGSFKDLVGGDSNPELGGSFSSLIDKLVTSDWMSKENPTDTEQQLRSAYEDVRSGHVEIAAKNNKWLQISFFHLSDGGRLCVIIDASQAKAVNEQLVQTGKLASLGEMAAGIAHEINQPLNVIKLASLNLENILSSESSYTEPVQKRIERIISQVDRAAKIIDQMRLYGREAKESSSEANPLVCIKDAVEMLSAEFKLESIDTELVLPERLPLVKIHPIKLVQVLVVMMTNARDAFNDNSIPRQDRILMIRAEMNDSDALKIILADSAGGIPSSVISKVMDPFFTTKPPGSGTGLGLSIASRIITDASGHISVNNRDAGAVFEITLPVGH